MRRILCLLLVGVALSSAQTKFDPKQGWKSLLTQGLPGWRGLEPSQPNEWLMAQSAAMDPVNPKFFTLGPAAAKGILVNGKGGKTINLITDETHGDVEAFVEFMVPQGSNSGVYFQGRYEIQILDSYGKSELQYSDCGGVYGRYIDGQTVGGVAPRVNAGKPPGEWQSFQVWFRAPQFDASGKKTQNARLVKVLHNGVTIHENVDVEGPTRASITTPEGPTGPLMLQGDHGPVAFRQIYLRGLK